MSDVSGLDVRTPMGIMFALLGAILTVDGVLSDPKSYAVSLGINVNLYWGVVILAFGLVMLLLAFRAARRPRVTRSE